MADKKTYPKGYHFLKPFVDVDGLYYMKGVRVPEEDGKHPTTIMFNKILPKKQIYPPLPEATLDPDLKPEVKESQQATPELDELYKKVNSLTDLVNDLQKNRQPMQQIYVGKEEKPDFGKGTRNIPPEDFDKEGKRYFMFGSGGPFSVYYKNGQEILAPYNVTCEFKFFRTEQRPIDGQSVPIPFAMFETHSKKEMKFIEGAPTYGILISEHFGNVVKITTTTEITRLETTLQRVQQMSNEELYVQAAKYNIPEGIGPDEIRNKIAWKLAKEEMEKEDSLQKSRIEDAGKETALFKTSAT